MSVGYWFAWATGVACTGLSLMSPVWLPSLLGEALFIGGLAVMAICAFMGAVKMRISIKGNVVRGAKVFIHGEGDLEGLEIEGNDVEADSFLTSNGAIRRSKIIGNKHRQHGSRIK